MPWPSELAKFIRIGRIAGNDIVLDDPRVSSHHARLMIVGGSDALIEDLGSSNGTFLNSAENRVTRLTPLSKYRHGLFRKSGGSGGSTAGRLARSRRAGAGAASGRRSQRAAAAAGR